MYSCPREALRPAATFGCPMCVHPACIQSGIQMRRWTLQLNQSVPGLTKESCWRRVMHSRSRPPWACPNRSEKRPLGAGPSLSRRPCFVTCWRSPPWRYCVRNAPRLRPGGWFAAIQGRRTVRQRAMFRPMMRSRKSPQSLQFHILCRPPTLAHPRWINLWKIRVRCPTTLNH